MCGQPVVDIAVVVEQQRKLSKFFIRLVCVSWVVTFLDSLDLNIISYSAPYLGPRFHLSRLMIGNVFSAGFIGMILGAVLLGYIGDRIGRRRTVILATTWFGLATLSLALATGYRFLLTARFLDGLGAGGFLPLIWSLNIEYAPKLYRSTLVVLTMVGWSSGQILCGPVAVVLIPRFGWQSVFVFGGGLSLLAVLVLLAMLPESIRFLASKGSRPNLIAQILEHIAPGRAIPGARYIVGDEGGQGRRFTPRLLFAGELRRVTPLLWIAYACSSVMIALTSAWSPMFFEAMGFTRSDAAWASTICALAGLLGSLALMRFLDYFGAAAITLMPVVYIPLMLITGLFPLGHTTFFVLYALIVTFVTSGQNGMHSMAGIFYPSAYRSSGAGWAAAIGKIGSALGPMVGGLLLSSHLPVRNMIAVPVAFPAVMAVCVFFLGRIHRRILGREALEVPAEPTSAAAAAH